MSSPNCVGEKMSSPNCVGEDPQWLFFQYQQEANILIIDCRPFTDYSKAHIEGAINISISSLMLRRLKKGNVPLKNFINSEAAKTQFDDRLKAERVVLYDEQSDLSNYSENSILQYLQEKLGEDNNSVAILKGGFRVFEESFPHLCQCGDGAEVGNAIFSLSNMTITNPDPLIPSPLLDSSSDPNNNTQTTKKIEVIHNAKDLLFRPDSSGPIEIIPHLYLGNKTDSSVLTLLQKADITHILNVTHDLPNVFEDSRSYEYLKLPVQDNWDGNVMDLFPKAYSFIDSAVSSGGNVLVHCLGGISRSSTIIIAYLMHKLGYNLNDAYDYVKSKKSNIAPNFNFMGQLLDFEKSKNVLQTQFSPLPCSVSPGLFSDGSSISTSSVESNTSY